MLPAKNFLCSFRPLAAFLDMETITANKLKPFVDASCRREPDLESKYPSISALCRKEHFAPRLRVGSKVVYISTKGRYFPSSTTHWRLVAILEVTDSFSTHEEAAAWYRQKGERYPSNCMIHENLPLPLEKTGNRNADLDTWDGGYQARAKECGIFHICRRKLFCELEHPPVITEKMMVEIFGRIPGTMTPPAISEEAVKKFLEIARKG